jgi:hypothetical protein
MYNANAAVHGLILYYSFTFRIRKKANIYFRWEHREIILINYILVQDNYSSFHMLMALSPSPKLLLS